MPTLSQYCWLAYKQYRKNLSLKNQTNCIISNFHPPGCEFGDIGSVIYNFDGFLSNSQKINDILVPGGRDNA